MLEANMFGALEVPSRKCHSLYYKKGDHIVYNPNLDAENEMAHY